jgi:hypothetical protein
MCIDKKIWRMSMYIIDDKVQSRNVENAHHHGTYFYQATQSKIVYQYDLEKKLIKIWPSGREADEELNYTRGRVSKACNASNTCKGYWWRHIEFE